MQDKRILGLDLSMGSPGFAVIDVRNGSPYLVHASHTKTDSKLSHGQRLIRIEKELIALVEKFGPFNAVAREKGFSMHALTTQVIFRVVGVSDLTLAKQGYLHIAEYAPSTVKKAMVGNGKASKKEVESAVRQWLTLSSEFVFKTDDESDACAVALTYAIKEGLIK